MSINPHLPLVYHPNYSFEFDPNHRFVMSKFADLYQHLVQTGYVNHNIFKPLRASISELEKVHCSRYLHQLNQNTLDEKASRRIGLPWSEQLMARTFIEAQGTLLTAQLALKNGIACHLAGGTHHAHYDFGSGFCMVNDLAYTATSLIDSGDITNVLIFDLDVHQGDGTAAILQHHPYIFTCSIHCEKNFPFRKSQSDLDIGLAICMQDDAYLALIESTLRSLIADLNPSLVLYDAGVDIWQHDGLGKLDISWQGIEKRDHTVLSVCQRLGVPVVTVIGGGYDKDPQRLSQRHSIVVQQAAQF